MVRLVGTLALVVSCSGALFLAGCASPVGGQSTKTDPSTSKGPPADLGSFVNPPDDLAQPPVAHDMAMTSSPPDLAMNAPKDMSMPPADMATASGCGSITYAGTCTGDILRYCNAGTLVTVDCWAQYLSSCQVVGGNADCYF